MPLGPPNGAVRKSTGVNFTAAVVGAPHVATPRSAKSAAASVHGHTLAAAIAAQLRRTLANLPFISFVSSTDVASENVVRWNSRAKVQVFAGHPTLLGALRRTG